MSYVKPYSDNPIDSRTLGSQLGDAVASVPLRQDLRCKPNQPKVGCRVCGPELYDGVAQINPLPNLPVPLGIGQLIAEWLGMRVGVSDINLHGRVRINMRPLMAKLPIVGGVKVCLFLHDASFACFIVHLWD